MTDPLKSAEDIYEEIDERAQTKIQKRELVISAIQAERKRAEGLEKELASCQKRGQRYLEVMKKTAEALNAELRLLTEEL